MKYLSVLAHALLLCILLNPLSAWEMADVTIQTPWASEVDPENPLPEYPRPVMVRDEWMNLNGVWEFQIAEVGERPPHEQTLKREILVPFPWQSALSGIREHFDSKTAWYRRSFELPASWEGQRLMLQFGAVDWETTVYVNGEYVGEHRGGFDPFELEITHAVSFDEPNTIVIRVFDPGTDTAIAVGKQSDRRFEDSGRYTYSPVSGIWQTVWIEPVPEERIVNFKATPDIDLGLLRLNVNADVYMADWTVEAIVKADGKVLSKGQGELSKEFVVKVENARLWWPEDPYLYDLELRLINPDGKIIDTVDSYFGMRKIDIKDTTYIDERRGRVMGPIKKMFLNNKFIFHMGPLDQGYWPDGLFTAPTDEALKWDVEQTKAWGYNMTRKHIKIEPQRWYYWCDKIGLLVWQDMPSTFNARTDDEKAQFEIELSQMVRDFWNHPSIVNWVVFNEHWGAYDVKRLTEWVMELDTSRLVTGNSGIDAGEPDLDYQVGHIKDNHHYRPPTNPYPTTDRAVVNGEYGAIGYIIEGHVWNPDEDEGDYVHFNYDGIDAATEEYERFVEMLHEFKRRDALSGAVYTQWTDLESEMNGIYTYDRKVEKLHRDRITEANESLWKSDYEIAQPESEIERVEADGGPESIQ